MKLRGKRIIKKKNMRNIVKLSKNKGILNTNTLQPEYQSSCHKN